MVKELLNSGKENAIRSRDLCAQLGGIEQRVLTAAVERERRDGAPICASYGPRPGFYLAESKGDMLEYCRVLEHREKEIAKTRRACQAAAETLPE